VLQVTPKVVLFWFYDPNIIVCGVQTAKSRTCGNLTLKPASVLKLVVAEIVAKLNPSKRFLKYAVSNQSVC
jgi:hypothetical protein